ncbi:HNH/endonuclease VII fold putative polymorphic toxin [Bacillus sp. 4A_MP2]
MPRSQQPTRQWQVGDNVFKKGQEYRNYEYSSNHTHHGRYYEFDTPKGKRVIVQHTNDGKLHTHAGKPKRVQIHLIMILKKKDIQIYMDQMVITISITMNNEV